MGYNTRYQIEYKKIEYKIQYKISEIEYKIQYIDYHSLLSMVMIKIIIDCKYSVYLKNCKIQYCFISPPIVIL